jgi:hypothetical protein
MILRATRNYCRSQTSQYEDHNSKATGLTSLRAVRNSCELQEGLIEQTQLVYPSDSIFTGHKDIFVGRKQAPRKIFSV